METLHAATGGTIKHVEGDKVGSALDFPVSCSTRLSSLHFEPPRLIVTLQVEQLKFSNVDVDEPRHLILDGQHVEYRYATRSIC